LVRQIGSVDLKIPRARGEMSRLRLRVSIASAPTTFAFRIQTPCLRSVAWTLSTGVIIQ